MPEDLTWLVSEIPVFIHLPSLEDLDHDEELSDSNDADFEIKDDSTHKRFNQHELKDLPQGLGLSKKASKLWASRLSKKSLLEKEVKVS